MTDLEILEQLIKGSAKIPITSTPTHEKASVVLDEPQSPDSSVTILGLPSDAIVIKAGAFPSPDAVLRGTRGECKRADYVIVTHSGTTRKLIIYIEIKKTKDSWESIVKQLKATSCFISYCEEIGKAFWNNKEFLKNYKSRFISIGHTSIAKRKTRIERKSAKHDTPEKALKIDWPGRLQFNHLAGARSRKRQN